MTVLVTGAAGYVGSAVVASLGATRPPGPARVPHRHRATAHGVQHLNRDVTDPESVRAAAEGCEAIVHLVAILNGSDAEIEAVNTGGARNAVAAARANGIRRLVHMSALGVSKEHAPLTRYWGSKYAGKLAVTESDLDWTVMEPSFVFGNNGGALKTFESLIRTPLAPVIGDGRYRHQPVWLGDVATAFVRALERPQTIGRTYGLGGPQAFEFNDLLDELARVTGRTPRRKLHAPAGLMKAQAAVLQYLPPPLKVTRDQIVMLLAGTECELAPMRADLGIEPASIAEAYTR
jgi:uncharacterized protein YbjT (DUF2867 family)